MNTATTSTTISINVYRGSALIASHVDLDQEVIKIGRLKSCHLCLEDESLARMHAILERTGEADQLRAIDLGSAGGLTVNGVRVDRNAPVRDGDTIELGPFRLELALKIGAPALRAPARPQAPRRAASRPSAITIDPREVEIHDGTRVAEVVAVYGDTVLDVQHVGQRDERRKAAPTWMAIGGLLALGGAALFGYEASRDWDGYREAAQTAAVAGAPAPVKPGTGLGGLGLGPAFAQKRLGRDRAEGGDRARGGGGVGRVGLDQDGGIVATLDPRAEIGRDRHGEGDLAACQQLLGLGRTPGDMVEAVVIRHLKRRDDGARIGIGTGRHQHGRQVLRIVVDGVAEEHELHQRHAEHH
ncbi:MAG: FHA domain-containing protein, partial [Myxococcales bacterium]|nr:FHA domain-containing protein [Myxococcales bacterium]